MAGEGREFEFLQDLQMYASGEFAYICNEVWGPDGVSGLLLLV